MILLLSAETLEDEFEEDTAMAAPEAEDSEVGIDSYADCSQVLEALQCAAGQT